MELKKIPPTIWPVKGKPLNDKQLGLKPNKQMNHTKSKTEQEWAVWTNGKEFPAFTRQPQLYKQDPFQQSNEVAREQ